MQEPPIILLLGQPLKLEGNHREKYRGGFEELCHTLQTPHAHPMAITLTRVSSILWPSKNKKFLWTALFFKALETFGIGALSPRSVLSTARLCRSFFVRSPPRCLYMVASDGTYRAHLEASKGTQDAFWGYGGIAVDDNGNVIMADDHNHCIRVITADGVSYTLAGGSEGAADGQGRPATFLNPLDVAVDGDGNVVVADDNHCIRLITPQVCIEGALSVHSMHESSLCTSAPCPR